MKEIVTKSWRRLNNEPDLAFELFCYYKDMGYERSFTGLIEAYSHIDLSAQQVESFRALYSWDKRCRDWDNYREQQVETLIIKNNIKRKIKVDFVLTSYITEFAARMQSGKIKGLSYDLKTFLAVIKAANDIDKVDITKLIPGMPEAEKAAFLENESESALAEINEEIKRIENMSPEEQEKQAADELKERLKKRYGGRAGFAIINSKNAVEQNGDTD